MPCYLLAIVSVLCVHLIGCSGGEQALQDAITSKRLTEAQRIIDSKPSLANATDYFGDSMLALAVERTHVEMVELLLINGASTDIGGKRLGIPLHHACFYGDVEIVALLLQYGADMRLQATPYIQGTGAALHNAASGGQPEVAKLLLDEGADVNAVATMYGNWTPLHFAVCPEPEREGRFNLVKLLVDHGAKINAVDSDGVTPLQTARLTNRYPRIIEFLESLGDSVSRSGH